MEKCFIFKDKIMELAQQGKIDIDLSDDVASTNMTTITFGTFIPKPLKLKYDVDDQNKVNN